MTTIVPTHVRKDSRLGTDLTGITNIDEAMRTAGLDWNVNIVEAEGLMMMNENGVTTTSIPGMRMVMRSDNQVTLGVVGGRYQPVDNHEVFALGEHIMNQGGKLTAGGSLNHGRRTFMRFDLPEAQVNVGGVDLVKFGVALRANHDGSGTVSAGVEGLRLVCTNGMTVRMNVPHAFSIRHTANARQRLATAETILLGAITYAKEFGAVAEEMLTRKFSYAEFLNYIDTLYPKPDEKEKRATALWSTRRNELAKLFRFADTNALGRFTQWSAFNAVTEYLDWAAPVRTSGDQTIAETRAIRQFDNATQVVKDRAFSLLNA
ncbi:DUF932 domain-containing protein [Glutamicibacter arilaitensis]|uniref:DUF932 domain-containing protein n=1 Tax=Glutamicibacter arilaitensis TaxID=256701 RepID=UPI003FD53678